MLFPILDHHFPPQSCTYFAGFHFLHQLLAVTCASRINLCNEEFVPFGPFLFVQLILGMLLGTLLLGTPELLLLYH